MFSDTIILLQSLQNSFPNFIPSITLDQGMLVVTLCDQSILKFYKYTLDDSDYLLSGKKIAEQIIKMHTEIICHNIETNKE